MTSMRTLQLPYRARRLEGKGIGGLFSRLGSFVRPLLKTAIKSTRPIAKQVAKQLATEGISATTSTAADMLSGVAPKEAIRKQGRSP